ncbi:MAG: hypothetical protein ACI9VT_003345, partial [Psychroserpens sp.]
ANRLEDRKVNPAPIRLAINNLFFILVLSIGNTLLVSIQAASQTSRH